ncbi:hypothetical protein HJG60_008196 [Phyllostomus discolor]|uniref:Uncharacterized protein n=1 Tax=Phyllostomus discolor TaxID=89673 RepID=A0A833Z953_9CHIR|nr:hypothetical protein HJG60_008196 [Phyllostomus discolor]
MSLVPVSLGTLKMASLQSRTLGASAKGRGLENVSPEVLGTRPVLTCVFATGPWVPPCQECHPLPAVAVEILSAFSRLSLGTNLCPTKPCEPSHPHPNNKNLSFLPLHSLSALSVFFSGHKFCVAFTLSWDRACFSC